MEDHPDSSPEAPAAKPVAGPPKMATTRSEDPFKWSRLYRPPIGAPESEDPKATAMEVCTHRSIPCTCPECPTEEKPVVYYEEESADHYHHQHPSTRNHQHYYAQPSTRLKSKTALLGPEHIAILDESTDSEWSLVSDSSDSSVVDSPPRMPPRPVPRRREGRPKKSTRPKQEKRRRAKRTTAAADAAKSKTLTTATTTTAAITTIKAKTTAPITTATTAKPPAAPTPDTDLKNVQAIETTIKEEAEEEPASLADRLSRDMQICTLDNDFSLIDMVI